MSDPRYTDPRLADPPLSEERRAERLGELESSNAMWGWVAGGIVLALLLVFIFGRGPNPSDTAATNMTPAQRETTGMAPRPPAPLATPRPATPVTPAPSAPSTTGQSSPAPSGSSSQ